MRARPLGSLLFLLALSSCTSDGGGGSPSERGLSEACALAFKAAAAVDDFRDTHADLYPAYRACKSMDEWTTASATYPGAIDGADPISYSDPPVAR